jgi:hypothetical protein
MSEELGSFRCDACNLRNRHRLRWPADAYFTASYKGHVLWAFDRDSATALNGYLGSKLRNVSKNYGRWEYFFRHIPAIFKTHKARAVVTKQLQRLLDEIVP